MRPQAANTIAEIAGSDLFEAVTPSDDADLDHRTRAIYIGTGGTIEVHDRDGNAVVFTVGDFQTLHVRTNRILDANTTATNIVALY